MVGMVYEWVSYWYASDYYRQLIEDVEEEKVNVDMQNSALTNTGHDNYTVEGIVNPDGPKTGKEKVFRGGSFLSEAERLEVTSRSKEVPGYRYQTIGFRAAKNL